MAGPFRSTGPKGPIVLAPNIQRLVASLFGSGAPRVLDFGCGYGDWIRYLVKLNPKLRYKAVDIDHTAQEYTRMLFPDLHDETASTFDVVMAVGLLELVTLEEQDRLLAAFKQWIAPRGVLFLQYNVYSPLSVRWILLAIVSLGRPKHYQLKWKNFRTFMTCPEVDALFRRHGYRILSCHTDKLYSKIPVNIDRIFRVIFHARRFYSTLYYVLEPICE